MKYRKLGNTGLFVSEICYGVMTFTGSKGWTHLGVTNQQEANELVKNAVDNGVNFFDTADIYSDGVSELMLGKAIAGKRNDLIITTKFGFRMNDGPNGDGLSRKRIIEACEASLKRLNTDYIDLYLIHSEDFITPLEETLGTLDNLVKQGKVRYIGCSNFYAWYLMKALQLCEKNNWEKLKVNQLYYSLLGRDIENEIIPACVNEGVGVMVWSPLHGGVLTGKYLEENKWPENARLKNPNDHLPYNIDKGNTILNELKKIALTKNCSVGQVSLAWLLNKKGITSVVIGAKNRKQLKENIKSSDVILSEDEMKILDEVSRPEKTYPDWYYEIFRKTQLKEVHH